MNKKSVWINVHEELPSHSGLVLVYCDRFTLGYYISREGFDSWFEHESFKKIDVQWWYDFPGILKEI